MSSVAGQPVSQEDVDAFREDGAVALHGVFADWVETLRAGVERNLADPGPDVRVYESEGEGGRFVGDYWIPLDPVGRETTVEFVAGSHRWGKEFRPERFNRTPLVEGDTREAVPDVEERRGDYRVLGWALEPGDAAAFHYTTLHGAPANTSTRTRRAFALRLLGDAAVFRKRSGPTSPPFRGLTLRDGDPLDTPEFPLLIGG